MLKHNENISYKKKELFGAIDIPNVPIVVLDIIIFYAFEEKYIKCNYYKSPYYTHDDNDTYRTIQFRNYSIEFLNGTCYVVNMFTNELISRQVVIQDIKNYKCIKKFVINNNKIQLLKNKNIALVSIIINDNKCEFIEHTSHNNLQNYIRISCNKKIIRKIKSELNLIFEKDVDVMKDSFWIDQQKKLSIIFFPYINELFVPYVLEYDLLNQLIIQYYELNDLDDKHKNKINGCGVRFHDEYMHVLCLTGQYGYICTYKKQIV